MSTRLAADFHRPAVFLVNGLGDELIALPAIRALATIFRRGLQILLGEGMHSFFYRGLRVSERVHVWWSDHEKRVIDVECTLAGTGPCNLFVCLSTWATPSAVVLARRMGATWSIGYSDILDELVPVTGSANMFDQLRQDPCLRTSGRKINEIIAKGTNSSMSCPPTTASICSDVSSEAESKGLGGRTK